MATIQDVLGPRKKNTIASVLGPSLDQGMITPTEENPAALPLYGQEQFKSEADVLFEPEPEPVTLDRPAVLGELQGRPRLSLEEMTKESFAQPPLPKKGPVTGFVGKAGERLRRDDKRAADTQELYDARIKGDMAKVKEILGRRKELQKLEETEPDTQQQGEL